MPKIRNHTEGACFFLKKQKKGQRFVSLSFFLSQKENVVVKSG
jgi:hypothetical protein